LGNRLTGWEDWLEKPGPEKGEERLAQVASSPKKLTASYDNIVRLGLSQD
jgi:hypothetical protein